MSVSKRSDTPSPPPPGPFQHHRNTSHTSQLSQYSGSRTPGRHRSNSNVSQRSVSSGQVMIRTSDSGRSGGLPRSVSRSSLRGGPLTPSGSLGEISETSHHERRLGSSGSPAYLPKSESRDSIGTSGGGILRSGSHGNMSRTSSHGDLPQSGSQTQLAQHQPPTGSPGTHQNPFHVISRERSGSQLGLLGRNEPEYAEQLQFGDTSTQHGKDGADDTPPRRRKRM
ncbi:hypothetical protein JX266_006342 [Neoarthrinium moseri]|nr:hypothetical protein JX266_006342 [Neoarthrinium moseri]